MAQALVAASRLIEDGKYDRFLVERYAGWDAPENQAMLAGRLPLEQIAERVARQGIAPTPRSGKQEYLENLLNRYL